MNAKIIGSILAALILGGVIGYSINRIQDPDLLHRSPVYREPIVVPDEVPKLSTQDAVTHRETHYENITDLKEIQALPSDFAQTEALYSVAGRSNVDELIVLLDEADRIANHHDRRGALQILFSRYAELDPEGLPVNLYATDYTELVMAVLNRKKSIQARPFAGMTPSTHGERQEDFNGIFEALYALQLRVAEEGTPAPTER